MAIIVREAELPGDREVLLSVLLRNRDPRDNALRQARFVWSYLSNPYGRPRAWFAMNDRSGRVIGTVSAFPRPVLINSEPVVCWNGGDTSIDKEFRTLGPAIKLREAVKDCVERGEMTFLYSHPVDRMRVVLERIGHVIIGNLPRYRLVLRSEKFLEPFVANQMLATALAKLGNRVLFAWPWNYVCRRGVSVKQEGENTFGDEYDELFERVGKSYRVITIRDSRFLTWRFLQNPSYKSVRIFRLQVEGELMGYAVLNVQDKAARIVDCLIEGDAGLARCFLAEIVACLRREKIYTLESRTAEKSNLLKGLRFSGVVVPDTTNSAVAVYTPSSGSCGVVLDERNWFMTEADRDV